MSHNINYKKKYIKYKQKYLNYKKYLQTQKGGSDLISIPSKIYGTIFVKKSEANNPGYMKFLSDLGRNGYTSISGQVNPARGDTTDVFQTMYNVNDLDYFYLLYLNPLVTFAQYTSIDKILMIGLGGGHLPMLVRDKFPNCKIDILEIDPDVLEASKIIGFVPDSKMIVHICDGSHYLNTTTEKDYNCIIMDLDSGPSYKQFNFGSAKRLLKDDGILAINFAHNEDLLSKKLLEEFSCVKVYNLYQYIYLCSKKDICDLFSAQITRQNASENMKRLKYLDDIIQNLNQSQTYVLKK